MLRKILILITTIFMLTNWVSAWYSSFYYWHCTWYVAKEKKVTWRWNAKDWLVNASNQWYSIWNKARYKSIVVFYWPWYNQDYWHTAIVENVIWDYIIISEMNYYRLWQITYRKISKSDINILWYIYV